MQFTRLRLTGFKSFVEPTDLVIEEGLTGVVGPNGCGKSNLMEALRWVMGENSYKNMRAAGMEDVIFAGTTGRPPRNTAEVMLVIDNHDRTAPAAFNDDDVLEVARQIERDYGSSYAINGRDVRARDVQLLFADASSGARSPALVRQGQIAELISAKPQARRRILEEAAGISGLNARRHETEMRLKSAETNLSRAEDVVKELAAQVESLDKQARQAARYSALSTAIRTHERQLYAQRWQESQAHMREAEEGLASAERDVLAAAARQTETARDQAVAAAALPDQRTAEAEAAAALQRLVIARDVLAKEKERAAARRDDVARLLEQTRADQTREDLLVQDAHGASARLAAESAQLEQANVELAVRRTAADDAAQAGTQRLADSDAAHGHATQQLAEAVARQQAAQRRLNEAHERLSRLRQQDDQLAGDQEELNAALDTGPDLNEMRLALAAARQTLAAQEQALQAQESEHASTRQAELEARGPLQQAEQERQRFEVEIATLAKMLSGADHGAWPPVLEGLDVAPGYEIALGAALGDDLDLPLDDQAPSYWASRGAGTEDPVLPDGVASLARFVKAPPALARVLGQIGLVELADGPLLAERLKAGQRLVTLEGALWRWDGVTAKPGAPSAASRRLVEKNRLQDLQEACQRATATALERRAAFDTLTQATQTAAEAERTARQDLRAAQNTQAQAQAGLSQAEHDSSALHNRLAGLSAKRERLTFDIAEAERAAEEAGEEQAALGVTESLETAVQTSRARVAEDRASLAEARALAQTLGHDARMRAQRLDQLQAEVQAWEERRTKAAAQVEALKERCHALNEERTKLEALPGEISLQEAALIDALNAADQQRRAAADGLALAEQALREADSADKAATQRLSEAREQRARAETRAEASLERVQQLAHTIGEALDLTVAQLMDGFDEDMLKTLMPAAQLETKLDQAKRDRERLGAVNLRAEEESSALRARHESLVQERDDLIEAIARLRQGIQTLNREGRERLLAAFATVNDHFQTLFTTLFGGGTAELMLTESDDPLEAGLDIMAHPPGKKPQSLSLLSGGEQALTAMALIFAVFLTNPAPICVLDEVDAPLDDHNVERYCDLLHKMVETTATRFIVITHNPITMARMHRLFGVTMAERGVSQLVSVDLQAAERLVEAA